MGLLLTGLAADKPLLLKNGNIITVSGGTIEGGDVLVQAGKIVRVGKDLGAPGVETIDLKGQWVMPGIIDSHSHIAVEGDVNEMGDLITSEVDVRDVINPRRHEDLLCADGGRDHRPYHARLGESHRRQGCRPQAAMGEERRRTHLSGRSAHQQVGARREPQAEQLGRRRQSPLPEIKDGCRGRHPARIRAGQRLRKALAGI